MLSSVSSSVSLSRSSSTSHRRLAAFRVRLAGGVAASAGEGASRGVVVGGDGIVGWDGPLSDGGEGIFTDAAGARLRRRRRHRTSGGAQTSAGDTFRRQEMVISLLPAWWQSIRRVRRPELTHRSHIVRKSCLETAVWLARAPSLTTLAQEGAGVWMGRLPGRG